MTLWTAADGGGVGGMWTPAYPGELPETVENKGTPPGGGEDWNPADEYNWFYGNGQFHISEDHEFDELASHANVRGEHTGPVAMGTVHVDMGKATWRITGNVAAHGLARILKDYTETAGWQWGGMTDIQGEPVDTGSEFAPVKSYYISYEDGIAKLARKKSALKNSSGAAHIRGKEAFLYGTVPIEAVTEWARDNGLTLISANANDGHETPQGFIPWEPGTGGKGLRYGPKWYTWQTGVTEDGEYSENEYPHHGHGEEAIQGLPLTGNGDYSSDDWTYIMPNGEFTKNHQNWYNALNPEDDSDYDWHIAGNDTGLKRIEDLEIDNNGGIFLNPDDHMQESPKDERQPSGTFKCPDCERLFPTWGLYLRHRTKEEPMGEATHDPTHDTAWLDMDATFPPHFHDQPTFHEAAEQCRWSGTSAGNCGWQQRANYICMCGAHTGPVVPNESATYGHVIAPHAKGVDNVPRERRYYYGADAEGKDLVVAPIPFIYDIQDDSITVGKPGTKQSDIPGQFTPGGIVEGTYEPGGAVHIRSMTNMPYTVRHMLELWYYNYPHMEIKSVDLTDDAGKQTKLAGQDVGGYVMSLAAADPIVYRAWKALEAAGGKVFIVGGAVRDAILGKAPHDFDLMVTGLPADEVHKTLAAIGKQNKGGVDLTGKDFGVFRYHEGGRGQGKEVEVALPRRERATGGGGHKDFMVDADHTMTPEEDLYRRDFTANAMAIDLSTGQLLDPFGGLADLQAGQLRTLHTKSLSDDPLRTMRALTAIAKHGLQPTSETEDQMMENAPGLKALPADRIKSELDKMFGYEDDGNHKDVDTAKAMRLAMDTGLMQHIFPEVEAARDYDQKNPHHEQLLDQHLLSVLEHAQKLAPNDPDLKLAALLHDIGKPASRWSECRECFHAHPGEVHVCENCGGNEVSGHFYQKAPGIGGSHEEIGADLAAARLKDLRYPNDRANRVSALIMHHMFPGFNTEKGARRFLNRVGDHADSLLTLRQADQGGKSEYPTDPSLTVDDHRELINKVRAGNAPTQLSQLAVNGRDLLAAGIPQGPEIGKTLQYLQEQVLENPQLNTKDALLGLLRARTGAEKIGAPWGRSDEWREIQQWGSGDAQEYFNDYPEDLAPYTEWLQSQPSDKYPVTHNPGHRLNWKPGTWGKGTVDERGNFHTWNLWENYHDGALIHEDYERRMGIPTDFDGAYDRRFHIHPDGFVGHYGTYQSRTMPFNRWPELAELDSNYHANSGLPSMHQTPEDDNDWT